MEGDVGLCDDFCVKQLGGRKATKGKSLYPYQDWKRYLVCGNISLVRDEVFPEDSYFTAGYITVTYMRQRISIYFWEKAGNKTSMLFFHD